MSKTFRPWDVDQGWLLPPSIHEFVPAGHLAHFVRDTVREGPDPTAIPRELRGGARLPVLSPGDDGGAAALRLQPWGLLVAGIAPVWWTPGTLSREVFADARNPSSIPDRVPPPDGRAGPRRS